MVKTRAGSLTALFILMFAVATGQTPATGLPELLWAAGHPFAALKVKKTAARCDAMMNDAQLKSVLDPYAAGGRLDAFRHIFYMAAFSQKVKGSKIRKLGRAHERSNYRQFRKQRLEEGERPDSIACEMDLGNNNLGITIGSMNKNLDLQSLKELVISEIRSGNAFLIKRNAAGLYVTCSGETIDLKTFSGRWYVPKCLIHPYQAD